MARTRRKDEELAARRGRILDAAARVFARRGLEAASMQEIASEAGYGTSSLYSYFQGKHEIVEALREQLEADASSLFDLHVPAGLTLRQALELLLNHQNEFAERNRLRFRLFVTSDAVARDGKRRDEDFGGHHIERLRAFLGAHAQPGDLGSHDPGVAAAVLYGMHYGLFSLWLSSGMTQSLHELTTGLLDLFEFGIRGQGQVTP